MNFTEIQIAKTFINIMKYYLISYFDENAKVLSNFEEYYHNCLIFALVWSCGGILEESIRPRFQKFIISVMQGINVSKEFSLPI
jgi:hypothetical protein